jgi:hypothetical protein
MRGATAAVLTLGAAALLAACGSGTKTVSVAGSPPAAQSTATQSGATTPSAPAKTAPAPSAGNGGTPASSTRTAPEPAFTQHQPGGGEGVSAAAAVVRAHGYTPNDTAQYHSSQTLRVLVGTHTGSGDGRGQQAFFFVDGRYIGTDASTPSATLKVISQSDTEVKLAYPLYRHSDALCCPSGGQATVSFQLNNGKLAPLSAIPPANSTSGLSRQ